MRLIIIILFLLGLTRISGQDFPIVKYSVDDGLVQREVMGLDIDPEGALWIGTKGGVSRFNGFQFVNYTTREGLFENEVKSLLANPDGSVWVFHYNGISVINGFVFLFAFQCSFGRTFRNSQLSATELAPLTWVFETDDNTAMYLLEGEKESLLIDTGTRCDSLDIIVSKITKKPFKVVITHGHPDHAGNMLSGKPCLHRGFVYR